MKKLFIPYTVIGSIFGGAAIWIYSLAFKQKKPSVVNLENEFKEITKTNNRLYFYILVFFSSLMLWPYAVFKIIVMLTRKR